MLDRDPHHAEPASLPPLQPFTCARLRASPARSMNPSDPTGTGDPGLNAESARRGESIHLAAAIVRDLILAARKRHRTIAYRREVLAEIDALLAEAEAIGPTEPWTYAVLFDRKLLAARDRLRRYVTSEATPR